MEYKHTICPIMSGNTAVTLTADYDDTKTIGERVDSNSQMEFHCIYTPHAANLAGGTARVEVQVEYHIGDPDATDANSTWYTYKQRKETSADVFEMTTVTFRQDADGAINDPFHFSFALGCRKARLSARETNAGGNFGTLLAYLVKQPI